MTVDERFEKFAKRLGFTVGKPYSYPRDLRPVMFRGIKLFNVPAKMYELTNENYRLKTVDMAQRNLFECMFRCRLEWYRIHASRWYGETLIEMTNQKFNPHEYEV